MIGFVYRRHGSEGEKRSAAESDVMVLFVNRAEEEGERDVESAAPGGGCVVLAGEVPAGEVLAFAVAFLAQEGVHFGLPRLVVFVQTLAAVVEVEPVLVRRGEVRLKVGKHSATEGGPMGGEAGGFSINFRIFAVRVK